VKRLQAAQNMSASHSPMSGVYSSPKGPQGDFTSRHVAAAPSNPALSTGSFVLSCPAMYAQTARRTRSLNKYCPIRRMPVEDITVDHVKRVLQPFWDKGQHVSACKLLNRSNS